MKRLFPSPLSMSQLAKKIVEQKRNCYFVSPRIGDAAFWLGGVMTELSGKVNIAVVNIFTAVESIPSPEDTAAMKQTQIPTLARLMELRMTEDRASLEKINAQIVADK